MDRRIKIVYFVNGLAMAFIYLMMPYYLDAEIGLNGSQIGFIMSISTLVSIVATLLWGYVIDKTNSSKLILRITMTIGPLIAMLFFVPAELGFLYYAFMMSLLSFVRAPADPVNDNLVSTYAINNNYKFSNFRVYGALGYALSSIVMVFVGIVWGVSVLYITLVLAASTLLWATGKYPSKTNQIERPKKIWSEVRSNFTNPHFLFMIFNAFFFSAIVNTGMSYQGILIGEVGGFAIGVAIATFLSIMPEIFLMRRGENLIERIGYKKTLIICYLLTLIKFTLFFVLGSPTVILIVSAIHGFTMAIYIPWVIRYIKINIKTNVPTAVLMWNGIFIGLGSIIFTYLAGVIYEDYSIQATYLFLSCFLMVGLMTIIGVMPNRKNVKEERWIF